MKKLFLTLRDRWRAKTPLIFSRIIKIAMTIGSVALAIQTSLTSAAVYAPEWWVKVLPYLIGAGAGASVVAKLTRQYDNDDESSSQENRQE